jgi:hypothetical protein
MHIGQMKKKMSFFEKKNQKTFDHLLLSVSATPVRRAQTRSHNLR